MSAQDRDAGARPPAGPGPTDGVRTLAGRLARECGDSRTVIERCTRLLLERTPQSDPSRAWIDEIRRAGDRTGDVMRELLALARGQASTLAPVDLNALLTGMRSLVGRLAGPAIEVSLDLEAGLASIHADAGALEEVIVNLVVGAKHALAEGGRLSIATRARPTGAGADRVELTVAETATGVPAATRDRARDLSIPPNTSGEEIGPGLAIVENLVTRSGGRIRVERDTGVGTTIRLEFPRQRETTTARDPAAGNETVLVAEDDAAVRALAGIALRAKGHHVLEAGDGLEALAISERHPGEIALLVTDVGMPRMEGTELASRLLERRPSLRVLFITGFGSEAVLDAGLAGARVGVLEKPFAPDGLVAAVRALLDRPR